MRSSVIVLGLALVSPGCGFQSQRAANGEVDAPGAETGADAAPGSDAASASCRSFSSQFDTCRLSLDGDLVLSGSAITYDTTTHVLTIDDVVVPVSQVDLMAKAGKVNAIIARSVRIGAQATLRATGELPLAIVASGSIALEQAALIDIGYGGAGALTRCSSLPGTGGSSPGGGGGGGGGGYGAHGGRGSNGNSDGLPPDRTSGGTGAGSIAMPAGPQGGCPGAPGGNGDSPGGGGGPGGGALYLVAGDRIDLGDSAVLNAGGGGGQGGNQGDKLSPSGDAGGGGGGSGGMILLEAAHIIGTESQIAANGGGGGEGSDSGSPGHPGSNGLSTGTAAAGGKNGPGEGADGGNGGSHDATAGSDGDAPHKAGGGGGGGGVGYIRILSTAAPSDIHLGSISPRPM